MRFFSICALFFAVANSALAAPMNNEDLIKLIKSGLSEALILQSIDGAEPMFDASANGLIQLKQAGAPDSIVQRVIQKKSAPQMAQSGTTRDGECKFRSSFNHIGIEDGSRFHDVGFQQASLESSINSGSAVLSVFTMGLTPVSGKAYAVIDGARSEFRLRERRPVFIDLNADRGLRPEDLIKLVKLAPSNGKRMVPIGEASESLFTSDEKIAFPPDMVIPMQFEQTAQECLLEGKKMSVYKAVPVQALPPGEYAIAYGEQSYYSFGVE